MKTASFPSFFHVLPRWLSASAVLIGALVSTVPAARAATKSSGIAGNLQGKYKVISDKIINNGVNKSDSMFPSTTYTIGAKGLAGLSAGIMTKIMTPPSGGSGPAVTITSASGTAMAFALSGALGESITLTGGTGTATLNSKGLILEGTMAGTKEGNPVTVQFTITLKAIQASTTTTGIAKNLQGSYKVKKVTAIQDGQPQSLENPPAATTFSIGAKGLQAVTGATISKIIIAAGGVSNTTATITSSTGTTLSATLAGTIGSHGFAITVGTATASLSSSGWTIYYNFTGIVNSQPSTVVLTIVLKKT